MPLSDQIEYVLDLFTPVMLQQAMEDGLQGDLSDWTPEHLNAANQLLTYVAITYGPTPNRGIHVAADALREHLGLNIE